MLADVRHGIWRPICADETPEAPAKPTFREFASEWLESRRHEFAARTVEDYTLTLSRHLLPFFNHHRVSELTHSRWRDVDLANGLLSVAVSKTAAGIRQVVLKPELIELLRKHKEGAEWSESEDFVFAGRIRKQPRERNSVRTKILYSAIERANELLAAEDRPPLPEGFTFHSLRHTYAALRAELGEHLAITAAQMGHRDPRMTLRVYTDVTGMKPRTRMASLLREAAGAEAVDVTRFSTPTSPKAQVFGLADRGNRDS